MGKGWVRGKRQGCVQVQHIGGERALAAAYGLGGGIVSPCSSLVGRGGALGVSDAMRRGEERTPLTPPTRVAESPILEPSSEACLGSLAGSSMGSRVAGSWWLSIDVPNDSVSCCAARPASDTSSCIAIRRRMTKHPCTQAVTLQLLPSQTGSKAQQEQRDWALEEEWGGRDGLGDREAVLDGNFG